MDLTDRFDIIKNLIKKASEIALLHLGRIRGQSKEDGTLVTQADRLVEECLIAGLQEHFPNETIVGEETGYHQAASNLAWSIDPIDGTSAYLCRLPSWGISVGLIDRGLPVLGVVYLPVLQEWYWGARNHGAYMESPLLGLQRLDITQTDLGQKEGLLLVPSTFHRNYKINAYQGKIRSLGSTVAHALTVARGDAAGAVMRIYHWDVAGALPILWEAGGCVDCLDGRNFNIYDLSKENLNRPVLLLSNPQAREELLKKIIMLQ
ncbi:MAG: inositol monophosphatase family protein [Candidatus Bruticola sp.]